MVTKYKLVLGEWKHYAILAELGAFTFYETFAAENSEEDMQAYISKTYSLNQIKENLLNPAIGYYVIYNEEDAMGYIKTIAHANEIEKLDGKSIELEKIYLRKKAQGTGMAKVLMQSAIDTAKSNNAKQLFLGVWKENYRALAFYKKCGFEIYNTRSFQLGNRTCEDYLLHLPII